MKKTKNAAGSLAAMTDVPTMAIEFGLSSEVIKKSLKKRKIKEIALATSFEHAVKLYYVGGLKKREEFAEQALEFCRDFSDFEAWARNFKDKASPSLRRKYIIALKTRASEKIEMAHSFEAIHGVWVKLDEDFLIEEYFKALQKMKCLTSSTPLGEVVRVLSLTSGIRNVFHDTATFGEIIEAFTQAATETEAVKTLRTIQMIGWWKEVQDSPLVQSIIRKAAKLYPRTKIQWCVTNTAP